MPPRARSVVSGSRNSISRDARKAIRVEGIAEIQERLASVIDATSGKQVKRVYHEAGSMLRDEARTRAPFDPHRKKGTHLRDAIFVDEGDPRKANVLVGVRYRPPGAPHAHLVEYGSSRTSAQPFFRPAIASTGARIGAHIKDGLRSIIDKAIKK